MISFCHIWTLRTFRWQGFESEATKLLRVTPSNARETMTNYSAKRTLFLLPYAAAVVKKMQK